MKRKGLIVALLGIAAACFAFADGSYTVKAVTGSVQYEASTGNWKNVEVGQTLAESTSIKTNLNSTLTLYSASGEIKVQPMKKGTVAQLAGTSGGKVSKGSTVAKGNVKGNTDSSRRSVSTASSRASEAKGSLDWEEE